MTDSSVVHISNGWSGERVAGSSLGGEEPTAWQHGSCGLTWVKRPTFLLTWLSVYAVLL